MTTPPVFPNVIEIRNDLSPLKAYEITERNEGDPIADTLIIKISRRKFE